MISVNPGPVRAELRIDIGGDLRGSHRLDVAASHPRSLEQILSSIKSQGLENSASWWTIVGGEPTLRSDLPNLLKGLRDLGVSHLGIRTDGLALNKKSSLLHLHECGLRRVVFMVSSLRADANDWIFGVPGGTSRLIRSIQVSRKAGMGVEAEIPITRPTAAHLPETVAALSQMGVERVVLRALRAVGPAGEQYISIAPRLGQIKTPLSEAVDVAKMSGMEVIIEDVPCCVLPGLSQHIRRPKTLFYSTSGVYSSDLKCPTCENLCSGVSADYIDRFGWSEIWDVVESPASDKAIRVYFHPEESSRRIRRRLVTIVQQGVQTLRITGDFNRPDIDELLRECLRLSIPKVEVCGEIQPLLRLSPKSRFMLRHLHRLDVSFSADVLLSPDKFQELIQEKILVLQKISAQNTGSYAVVSSLEELSAASDFDPPFQAVRLSEPGGAISDLAVFSESLSGDLKKDLLRKIPPCLHPEGGNSKGIEPFEMWKGTEAHERFRQDEDRQGTFMPCSFEKECSVSHLCPGLASGWDFDGIEPVS